MKIAARLRRISGAAAPFFFLLLFVSVSPAAEALKDPKTAKDAKPAAPEPRKIPFEISVTSKVVKHGLFAEELISMEELQKILDRGDKVLILDARGKQSYDSGHVKGAVLPLTDGFYEKEEQFRKGLIRSLPDREKDLAVSAKRFEKSTPIVTYCSDECQASAVLLIQLKRLGFADVRALSDGFQTWQKSGHPVEAASH